MKREQAEDAPAGFVEAVDGHGAPLDVVLGDGVETDGRAFDRPRPVTAYSTP